MRIVAFILIPCMVADPSLCHLGFGMADGGFGRITPVVKSEVRNSKSEILFGDQTLTARLLMSDPHSQDPTRASALRRLITPHWVTGSQDVLSLVLSVLLLAWLLAYRSDHGYSPTGIATIGVGTTALGLSVGYAIRQWWRRSNRVRPAGERIVQHVQRVPIAKSLVQDWSWYLFPCLGCFQIARLWLNLCPFSDTEREMVSKEIAVWLRTFPDEVRDRHGMRQILWESNVRPAGWVDEVLTLFVMAMGTCLGIIGFSPMWWRLQDAWVGMDKAWHQSLTRREAVYLFGMIPVFLFAQMTLVILAAILLDPFRTQGRHVPAMAGSGRITLPVHRLNHPGQQRFELASALAHRVGGIWETRFNHYLYADAFAVVRVWAEDGESALGPLLTEETGWIGRRRLALDPLYQGRRLFRTYADPGERERQLRKEFNGAYPESAFYLAQPGSTPLVGDAWVKAYSRVVGVMAIEFAKAHHGNWTLAWRYLLYRAMDIAPAEAVAKALKDWQRPPNELKSAPRPSTNLPVTPAQGRNPVQRAA